MVIETAFESERYYTAEEFTAWVEAHAREVARFELLNGRIVMNPPSGWPQGEASAAVAQLLRSHARAHRLGRVFGADQGFELPSGDTVAPDAAYVSTSTWSRAAPHAPGGFLRLVPDLAVEIVSPTSALRDRGEKKAIYERNGVAEYWVIDIGARRLERFTLADGRYAAPRVYVDQDAVDSSVLLALSFPLTELLPA